MAAYNCTDAGRITPTVAASIYAQGGVRTTMPIKIPDALPAKEVLAGENIFVMDETSAYKQDIRPLRIAILNLMPTKETTETQLLRLVGNTPIQVDIVLVHPKSHTSKNTSQEYLDLFYKTFDEIEHRRFDGMIITGAPVEQMDFEDVNYWKEIQEIFEWTKTNVTSTMHICWASQAGLYHHFGVPKVPLDEKCFGVFSHTINRSNVQLLHDSMKYSTYRIPAIRKCVVKILKKMITLKYWLNQRKQVFS